MSSPGAGRLTTRLTIALLANGMTWIAIWSWRGIVEDPPKFIGPALTAACLIAVTGALLRGWRLPVYVVLLLQLLVVLVWFHHHQDVSTYAGGWVPTPDGISAIADQIRTGASFINTYEAPVRAMRVQAPMYLLALALLLLLAVDLIAAGLRRPTWAGLPVLVALTVPISVLDEGLPWGVFIGTAVLFAMLLATVESEHVLAWGQAVTGRRQRDDGSDQILDRASAQAPALKIGLLAATGALVLPVFVPLSNGLFDGGSADGGGRGAGEPVHLRNPMANLRRDLVANDHVPLLEARTDSADPSYLRTTVLDVFDGSAWVPGTRDLPATNVARGRLPDPSGISATTSGTTSRWELRTTRSFLTSWLPTPYVTRDIEVDQGDWRYDIRTLDMASTDAEPPSPVSYRLTGYAPTIDPAKLESAAAPPDDILTTMSKVPGLSGKVADVAREVTAAGRTDYEKAVLLQKWFRTDGGFKYSLEPATGDGMKQLERFITTEKIGYCEQYAAAMAVMARALGIPARVIVGFLEPEETKDGAYSYTSSDLHAWPEIYFSGTGWVRFEPTPQGRTGAAPSWTRPNVPAATPTAPTPSPTQATKGPTQAPEPTGISGSTTGADHTLTTSLRLLGIVLVLALLAVPALLRRGQRRRRFARRDDARLEVENFWRELRATATDLRLPWPEGRSPRTAARLLAHRVDAGPDDIAELNQLIALLEEARYRGQFELAEDTRSRARSIVERWAQVLTEASPPRRARLAWVLPRSVFDARQRPDEAAPASSQPDPNSYTEVG